MNIFLLSTFESHLLWILFYYARENKFLYTYIRKLIK